MSIDEMVRMMVAVKEAGKAMQCVTIFPNGRCSVLTDRSVSLNSPQELEEYLRLIARPRSAAPERPVQGELGGAEWLSRWQYPSHPSGCDGSGLPMGTD